MKQCGVKWWCGGAAFILVSVLITAYLGPAQGVAFLTGFVWAAVAK